MGVAGPKEIPTCPCAAVTVICTECDSEVGYHVTQPCVGCGAADHNGHFWLFDKGVTTAERGLTWASLPYNGSSADAAADNDEADALDEADTCLICAASPM